MKKPKLLRLTIAFLSGLILTATNPAKAATYTWTNTAGGNWNVAANWFPNGVPGGTDSAAITNTGNDTVTVSDTESVGTLALGGIHRRRDGADVEPFGRHVHGQQPQHRNRPGDSEH